MSWWASLKNLFLTAPRQLPVDRFQFGNWEMCLMRLGFSILAYSAIKWEVQTLHDASSDVEKLTGLTHFINLNWIQDLQPVLPWKVLTMVGLLLYVMGILPMLGLLPALFFSITIGTLANSQGAINHSTQLVSMILLGQFLVYALPFGRIRSGWWKPVQKIHQRAVYVALVVFAASYVVSAFVKLDRTDGTWVAKVPSLALELQKANYSEYYDTLTPVPESLGTVVRLMNEHPTLAKVFFGAGLFVELFAFLILLGRRWALVYGMIIIGLHLSISHLMQLDFWYHMIAALIFAVNVPGIWKTLKGVEAKA